MLVRVGPCSRLQSLAGLMGPGFIHFHLSFRRYMSGSKNMSYDSSNLTTPDIKWLGVRPSDLDRCLKALSVLS
jgi:hypothetical protein